MSDRIKNLEVTTPKLATGAVTTPKIADSAVTADKIKDGSVKTDKIAEKQVTGEKIADRAITSTKIVDGAVTGAKIADGAVTRDKISNGVLGRPLTPPVATTEIADASVTEAKLQNNSVATDKVKDGAITGAKIAANTITQSDIAANAVGTLELKDSAVTTPKIVDGAVTPEKLSFTVPTRPLNPPLDTPEIGDGKITTAKIADRAVDWAKISLASINHELLYNIAPPTDGQIPSFDSATGKFKWIDKPTGGSKVTLINPQTVFDETATTDRSAPLDISTVIPATAIGVLVELHQDGQVPGWAQPSAQIQHPLGGVALTVYITGDAAGTHPHYADNAGIVPVYSPQNIYLVINRIGVTTRVKVTVTGYIE